MSDTELTIVQLKLLKEKFDKQDQWASSIIVQNAIDLLSIPVEKRVSPKVADNDISNWEVYHSNSGNTGICYNHPKAGDESVMIRNKVTKKFSFLQLNK